MGGERNDGDEAADAAKSEGKTEQLKTAQEEAHKDECCCAEHAKEAPKPVPVPVTAPVVPTPAPANVENGPA